MRTIDCPICKKEQDFETRVEMKGSYEYTYEQGTRCGHQISINKKAVPEDFKEAKIRRDAGRR